MRIAILLLLIPGTALAQLARVGRDALPQRLSGRVSLTGVYYAEQEVGASSGLASPTRLAYGDLRLMLNGNRLARRVDLRLDLRLRGTATFDYEAKYQPIYFVSPQTFVTARGYLGGPELDLREANLGLWLGQRVALYVGRQHVVEADNIRVDAARLQVDFNDHLRGGLFVGGYPNPYSRSLLTDYAPPCGSGVATGNTSLDLNKARDNQNPLEIRVGLPTGAAAIIPGALEPCQTAGAQLALAAGLTARYQFSRLWGHVGLVGSFLGGAVDGAVQVDPKQVNPVAGTLQVGNLLPAVSERDKPRVYLSWMNHVSPSERLDVFSDLVVDALGSSGAQLTRAALVGTLRALRDERLTVRASYTFLSSLAIQMWLNRLLYNRFPNGSTVSPGSFGIVENNLTVLRTSRHEARLTVELALVRRLGLWAEGRVRQRSLQGGESNPAVYQDPNYTGQERPLSGDASVGLRDGGSLLGVRAALSYTFLQTFRAQNHVIRLSVGKDLFGGRLSVDGEYVPLLTRDEGAGSFTCGNLNPKFPDTAAQIDPRRSVFLPDCFGRRSGSAHELGLTLGANPYGRLFLLADYRFSALLTDPQPSYRVQGAANPLAVQPVATVLGHAALLRIELGL